MAYTYHRSITVDHTKLGASSLTNYPMLVHLNDATFKTVANGGHVENASAFDVGFFTDAAATTPVYWEILSYDGSTGEIWAFANIPSVSHTVDTVFYVCYGDAGISTFQSSVSSVWSGFYRVMHLNEASHPYHDVTARADNSTGTADPTQVAGLFNLAQSFVAASNQVINVTQTGTGFNQTMSAWFKSSTTSGQAFSFDDRGNGSSNGGILFVFNNQAGYFRNNVGPIVSSTGICDGNWHYLVATSDTFFSTEIRLYVDGVSVSSFGSVGNPEASGNAFLGAVTPGNTAYNTCVTQELRQISSRLSADIILTDYNNQSSPDTFITVGAENGNPFGSFTGTADPLASFSGPPVEFRATAYPTATFESVLVHGYFVAAADPLASFQPGSYFFRASPTASFMGVDNAYTSMGFTAPAYPHLDLVGIENQAINAALTAHPQLTVFVPVGQSGRCASGEGVGHRDSSTPTNYVF